MNKKLFLISAIACCCSLSSCDMDLTPETNIATDESVRNVGDCEKYSNLFHAEWRGYIQGSIAATELVQSGQVVATPDYGNNYGSFYRWDFQITDGTIQSCWSSNYNYIANANLLIQKAALLLEDPQISDADKQEIKLYMGHAYFSRAMAYRELALHFCKDYNPSTAAREYGVPLVDTYNPGPNAETYPGRSSLQETYQHIVNDLTKAEEYVTTAGVVNSTKITADVVQVLKARVALDMEDYTTAANVAQALINKGTYTLISNPAQYKDMWLNDTGTEAIWQFYMELKNEEGPTALGNMLSGIIDKFARPSYMASKKVTDLYDTENDIRYGAYFKTDTIDAQTVPDFVGTYCNKWPGNPALYTGKPNNMNKTKAMRISEMYLLAAEAYAKSGNQQAACGLLNDLRKARISGWTDQTYSGDALMKEIQDERTRELFAEGFRFSDMKRWGIGFSRSVAEDAPVANYVATQGNDLTKDASDHMWVWPIPKDEIDANPQIKGQQNEGY